MNERKPGVWTLRVFVGRDVVGRPVQVSRTCRGSKREAQVALARYVAELSEGKPALEGVGATVGHLLDEWTALGQQRGWTPYTEHRYRSYVEGRIRPALGSLKLTKFGPEHCDRFYASLLAEGLSPTTVRHIHAIVASACELAVDWGWLSRNPAKRAHPPSRARAETRAPSAEEVTRIVNAAQELDPVKGVLLVVAAMTGARRGELCALRWSDIDWGRRTLTIARSLTVTPDVIVEGTTKTKKSRTISLGAMAIEHLKVHRQRCSDLARTGGVVLSTGAYVFSTSLDGSVPVKPDSLTQFHVRLMKKLGMDYRFHELRHFMATSMAASGVGIRTIAGRLGHADPALTLRTYSHWLETADRDAADAVENVLGGAMPT
jgi:integrase